MKLNWRSEEDWEKAIIAWLGPQRLSQYFAKDIVKMAQGAVVAAAILEASENLKPKEVECPCCKDWFTPCNNPDHTNEESMCAFCTTGIHNLAYKCAPSE